MLTPANLHTNVSKTPKRYQADIPPKYLLNKFNSIYTPIAKRISETKKQNQELASLRDWLLPMLMNGQVSVGEVERELGMVAEESARYEVKEN